MNLQDRIEFKTTHDNSWVMRITADRRIEVNEDVDVTEAAQKVLAAMQYLLQPKREWVGLTDEERDWFVYTDEKEKRRFREYGEYVEQRLKEKNHAT